MLSHIPDGLVVVMSVASWAVQDGVSTAFNPPHLPSSGVKVKMNIYAVIIQYA